jgi:hypothetical protein
MVKRRRTDNTMVKRRRTDNTMVKRKKDKGINNDPQNTTQKTKDEQHEPYKTPGVNSCALKG